MKIQAQSKYGNIQEIHGSDNRLDVSSRSDGRAYYNSRDNGQCYTVKFDHQSAVAGEVSLYLQNTSDSSTVVLSSVDVSSDNSSKVLVAFATGTAAGGVSDASANCSKESSKSAMANIRSASSGDPVTGLTEGGALMYSSCNTNKQHDFKDVVRLGQNDAIMVKYDSGTTGALYGTLTFYFE